MRYWESEVSSATSALSSAETELSTSQNRYSSNSCWEGRSPELSYSCVNRYKKKVEDKKTTKESYERNLNNAKKALNEEKDNSQVYAKGITARNDMKNAEIAKKAQYTKEKQEVEARIKGVLDQKKSLEADIEKQKAEQILINDALLSLEGSAKNFENDAIYENKKTQYIKEKQEVEVRMKGVLDQKSSLEAEIEKQKAEQIKINAELLSLEESAKNFDSRALETQKGALEQEFQDADAFEYKLIEYLKVDITGQYHQQQDL